MEFSTVDLSWLPNDADEQLALGFRVVSNAYKTRVSGMETELRTLRTLVSEKTDAFNLMQNKYNAMEDQLAQANQKVNHLSEENRNLTATLKKLQKDLDRLENLKKVVLASFQDEPVETEHTNRFFGMDDVVNNVSHRSVFDLNNKDTTDGFLKSLNFNSATRPLQDNPPSVSQRETVNGRQFFKNAKNLLHPDDFSDFLATIKKFNAQLLTREQTLAHAKQVFGEHSKAFEEFRQLINPRH